MGRRQEGLFVVDENKWIEEASRGQEHMEMEHPSHL